MKHLDIVDIFEMIGYVMWSFLLGFGLTGIATIPFYFIGWNVPHFLVYLVGFSFSIFLAIKAIKRVAGRFEKEQQRMDNKENDWDKRKF